MNTERNERRTKMLEKVRKLLAMGRDGRGNENEQETAMRQANKIMAEFGIAEAECDIIALDADEMVFGEAQCGPDGCAPQEGKVYRSAPGWAGILAVGVARFTDSIVTRKNTLNGQMFVFKGEKEDVLLARWIFGILIASIQGEQKKSGWTARGEAGAFRTSASTTLQKRLKALHQDRQAMCQEAAKQSNSRALVVVDRKNNEIAARFGTQRTRTTRSSYSSSCGAHLAGQAAGQRINIPSGRPIGQSNNARIGAA